MLGNVLIVTFYPMLGLSSPDQIAFEDFGYYVQNDQGLRLESFEMENGLIDDLVKEDESFSQMVEQGYIDTSSVASMILINYLLSSNSVSIENMTAYHGLYLSDGYSFIHSSVEDFAVDVEGEVCGYVCYK